jgi:hypothetical protein
MVETSPLWQERSTARVLGVDGKTFDYNLAFVGPMNWFNLMKADFGKELGFTRPTASGLVPLVHSAAHPNNRKNGNARTVLGKWLAGNTLVLLGREGLYGVDLPNVKGQRIYLGEKTLKGRLGSREERRVILSDDGLVAFTPYGFKTGEMDSGELAVNRGVAVAYKGFANAELLAQTSSHYKSQPYFGCASEAPAKPQIKVPGVCADDVLGDGLFVGCDDDPSNNNWYSFGVRSSASDPTESRSAHKNR